jgi:hypothetical protein
MPIQWNLDATFGGLYVGGSFFFPCVSCRSIRRVLQRMAQEFEYKVSIRESYEAGLKGLRVIRLA